jgi:hypothetical protein
MAHDAQGNLSYIEKQLAYFMLLVGLNPESLDSITIDEILTAARNLSKIATDRNNESLPTISISEEQGDIIAGAPEDVLLKNQRIFLILNIRRFWYWRQLAIGALSRG